MKYLVILGDGMADDPIAELGGKTPLEYAHTPEMDRLSGLSEIGLVHTVPDGMKPGSDTANLSVLGYDPRIYYSGRSPLEALSIGVDMNDTDVALRCNLVTVSDDELPYEEKTILDHSSGEISTEEAAELLKAVRDAFEDDEFRFYLGVSYRHLLIWDHGEEIDLAQPHDHLTEVIGPYLPAQPRLRMMMEKSYDILNNHPVNVRRKERGQNPANSLWFWGAGKKPALTSFYEKTGKRGAMISAVDLLRGIAVGAGMKKVIVPGADGTLHTNYEGKANAACDVLLNEGYDFAYIHVEAPDEMGHQGSVERKVKAIENLDARVISVVIKRMEESGEDYRLLILPDHPTPISVRTHTSDPVPYLLYDSANERDETWNYNEREAKASGNYVDKGYQLIDRLFLA